MPPIRVYLDTSDYAVMYCAPPDTPAARVRDELLQMKESRRIEISLSYYIVFELLQKAEPKFRNDRLARAKLLTQLCGQDAFPFPTDLPRGHSFSKEGLWVPRIWLDEIEIERIVGRIISAMVRSSELGRRERRALSKRRCFVDWVRDNPLNFARISREHWPLLFGYPFVKSGDLARYILGEINREQANKKLRFYITDPVTVYETWFENYGRENPIPGRRDPIASKLTIMIDELNRMLEEHASLRMKIREALGATGEDALSAEGREAIMNIGREIATFGAEITSFAEMAKHPAWVEAVGEEGALLAAQIFHAFHREKRGVRASDSIDLMHSMYLPHTDLWRGDKAFSAMLIKNRAFIYLTTPFYRW
jgi:hypothetical protein